MFFVKKVTLLSLVLFFVCSCGIGKVHSRKNERILINFRIYNFQDSGSTTLSNIIIVNGKEIKTHSYPQIIKSQGGYFMTSIKENNLNSGVICDAILIIQNLGIFRININNFNDKESVSIFNNKIIQKGTLFFNYNGVKWYVQTTRIGNDIYSVLVIISDLQKC